MMGYTVRTPVQLFKQYHDQARMVHLFYKYLQIHKFTNFSELDEPDLESTQQTRYHRDVESPPSHNLQTVKTRT